MTKIGRCHRCHRCHRHLFLSFLCHCQKLFVLLQLHLPRWFTQWMGQYYWVEHYILKGVTDALFLGFGTTTLELPAKTNAGWLPRGVSYTLRSVLWGSYSLKHTLRMIIYSNVGVSLSVFLKGCGRPRTTNRQMQAPTSFICGIHINFQVLSWVFGSLLLWSKKSL